jgi:hypothetical protein
MLILAEKIGTFYLPAINVINLRAQKEFALKDAHRLQLMLNIFNLTGSETVIDVIESTGRGFQQPSINIGGAVVRFAARYTF